MIKIELNMSIDESDDIYALATAFLNTTRENVLNVQILKKSIDARYSNKPIYVVSLGVKLRDESCLSKTYPSYTPPYQAISQLRLPKSIKPHTIAIIGSGPAGLFAALTLIECGHKPIIFERGEDVDSRIRSVAEFNLTGVLNEESNIQFGEGGAGTFSDGKVNTGVSDGYIPIVIGEFLKFGAPQDIRYMRNPHIGTDNLRKIVVQMRRYIIDRGGEFKFNTRVDSLKISYGKIVGITGKSFDMCCDIVVCAAGQSARDTYSMLHDSGVSMEQKAFSIGLRIEHLRAEINKAQYGTHASLLPAADYKLHTRVGKDRIAYTFCMCPGGEVVSAASERGYVVSNGMSFHSRDNINSNSAILVNVKPEDFPTKDVLAGIEFQRKYEKIAFSFSNDYRIPAQKVSDFIKGRVTTKFTSIIPSCKRGIVQADLNKCVPRFVAEGIKEALLAFDKKVRGFASDDAVLSGVETRTSAPVRILRKENGESNTLKGLYPAGEGAGYSGGIMSSAIDGIRVALKIAENLL